MIFNESYISGLAHSAPVVRLVTDAAERVAAAARADAPVDSGEYRDEISVEIGGTRNRVVATVVAASDHSMLVEAKHGTLARALRTASRG